MGPLKELQETVQKLRNGEEVRCKSCRDGIMRPIGDRKITHGFKCDRCGKMINLD